MPSVLNDPKLEGLLEALHQTSKDQDEAIGRYYREERTGPWNGMEPRDHAFMGTVDDWLFSGIAGISSTSPAFRTVSIDPTPGGGLTHASAYETTPLGQVSSAWTESGTSFALTVQVPVGSTASVCVPAATAQSVMESGVPAASAQDVTVTGMQASCLRVQVGSGTYRFRSTVS